MKRTWVCYWRTWSRGYKKYKDHQTKFDTKEAALAFADRVCKCKRAYMTEILRWSYPLDCAPIWEREKAYY